MNIKQGDLHMNTRVILKSHDVGNLKRNANHELHEHAPNIQTNNELANDVDMYNLIVLYLNTWTLEKKGWTNKKMNEYKGWKT